MASDAGVERILTSYDDAFFQLKTRQADDPGLRQRIEEHCKGDIPEHFKKAPFLHLARHIATPNFETLRFLHLVEPLNMRVVVTQDSGDKFTSHNPLKHAVGKLPICQGIKPSINGCDEHFESITIVDFNTANGKALGEVNTIWGESLMDFHNSLFSSVTSNSSFSIVDESAWMNDRFRGDPLEYYKHILPFFVVHGVTFEDYNFNDEKEVNFIEQYILPAFEYVEDTFGYSPLITNLVPTSVESARFWISYPHQVKAVVYERMKQVTVPISSDSNQEVY